MCTIRYILPINFNNFKTVPYLVRLSFILQPNKIKGFRVPPPVHSKSIFLAVPPPVRLGLQCTAPGTLKKNALPVPLLVHSNNHIPMVTLSVHFGALSSTIFAKEKEMIIMATIQQERQFRFLNTLSLRGEIKNQKAYARVTALRKAVREDRKLLETKEDFLEDFKRYLKEVTK